MQIVNQITQKPGTAEPEMMLIFRLSGNVFALPVGEVHEILDPMPTTSVPNAPAFAPALINVRGAIAPLIDIRQRLRMPTVPADDHARIIVLELPVNGVATRLAILADAVEEVIETDRAALKPVPELGARWPEQYVIGVARYGDTLVILLDTDTLFRPDAGPSIQA
ncbi:chemotaxis protein CheW [Pseudotabrizicola alkalilacus]|uniref:Purine-binding chemotaxis protein CheW n=1 Tax=Pseudotabrizicola alkalilacus TaxID=2305252 RepID=A0A411Z685_9RHOB|nr:chemotaxis protein CheW [Pseudotabrizicola alkalilacus]RGP38600.1 purine-binding chemotaxis protein CheW [Pseudotabrizicola alkalilacus]